MDQIINFLQNRIFLSCFFAWFLAQIIKGVIELIKTKRSNSKLILKNILWTTGGMPSSHSAAVLALATATGFTEGFASSYFVICFVFAAVTVRDALGVRRSTGKQAQTLNKLNREISAHLDIEVDQVAEVKGHNGSEVFVGMLFGFFIAVAFCNL